MEKYIEIKNLDEAEADEVICASYPKPYKNVSGSKDDDKIIIAAKDAEKGKCRLLVWRNVKSSTEAVYTLDKKDVGQIIIRYQNAIEMSDMYRDNDDPEYRFECGRAYALEGVLAMLGIDHTKARSAYWKEMEGSS